MNKVLLAVIAAVSFAGFAIAQDKPLPEPPTPEQAEYNEMIQWFIASTGKYEIMDFEKQMRDKIKLEFPMDQKLQEAVNSTKTDYYNNLTSFAKQLGITVTSQMTFDELYSKIKLALGQSENKQYYNSFAKIDNEYYTKLNTLTKSYNDEFNVRFEAACVDAIKRIKENAETMRK
jgi:hypothetical protein